MINEKLVFVLLVVRPDFKGKTAIYISSTKIDFIADTGENYVFSFGVSGVVNTPKDSVTDEMVSQYKKYGFIRADITEDGGFVIDGQPPRIFPH